MRWEELFGDLEAQFHAGTQQELEQHINELARIEATQSSFTEVLRGALGRQISATMHNGSVFHGVAQRVEQQWLLLGQGSRSVLLPLEMVMRVQGLGNQRMPAATTIPYTLPAALRVLARNRSTVVLEVAGTRPAILRGVLDQVGADYVQLMQMADGVGRDRGNAQGSVVIPLAGIVAIVSAADNEF